MLFTNLKNSDSIGLFYLGSPARVTERFDDCWYLAFEYTKSDSEDEWSTSYDSIFMGLEPADKVFYPKEDFIEDESEEALRENESAKLTDIVKEIMDSRIMTGDLNHQIDIVPGVRKEVKDIAKQYLELASKVK